MFNALNNFKVRRHVTEICLIVNVPLTGSGTTGCNSQIQVIFKNNFLEIFSGEIPHKHVQSKTECYNCNIKEVLKRFSVYTVYNISSQFIHCIIWAKNYLLMKMFGIGEDNSAVFNYSEDSDSVTEIENLCKKVNILKQIWQFINQWNFLKKYSRRSL